MRLHRPQASRLSKRHRFCAVVVAAWVFVALPMLALPPETMSVCMMACSLDDEFCCCKAFGHRQPFSVTGEASYLSSHLPPSPKDLCEAWAVMANGTELPPPSPTSVAKVLPTPRPMLAIVPPADPADASLSAPALPRPPPVDL